MSDRNANKLTEEFVQQIGETVGAAGKLGGVVGGSMVAKEALPEVTPAELQEQASQAINNIAGSNSSGDTGTPASGSIIGTIRSGAVDCSSSSGAPACK